MTFIQLRGISAQAHIRLHYFPIIASAAWSLTLTALLLRWLLLGRPQYPGQVNPHIPFISDIAAFNLKPLFVAGCALTAACFLATVACVHHVRYAEAFYGLVGDAAWRKATSVVALVAGLVAAACLLLLSVFDTFEEHEKHRYLLVGTFGGLAVSALTTEVVWWDETWGVQRFPGLRKCTCIINTILVVCITGVGVAFLTLLYTDYYGSAGVLEWTITYLGALWLGTFAGYIRFRDEDNPVAGINPEDERQPLLSLDDRS